jgi:hypothetical protein
MPGLSLGPGASERPGFGALLANSLRSEGATKAWFDEAGGYAYVRQSRVPLVLPKVCCILEFSLSLLTMICTLNDCAAVAGAASAAKGTLCSLWWWSAVTLQALHVMVGCVCTACTCVLAL